MAEITFIGAAETVTGSKHLISTGGKHFLVDCGLFQGPADVRALNDIPLPLKPSEIDAVVLTHGHIDHVGYLPKLVRDGFRGPVYCTPPTAAIARIVLDDAAHLQRMLYERGFHNEKPHAPPLFYSEDDVNHAIALLQTIPLHQTFDVCGVAHATYRNASHILGSAFVQLEIEGKRLLFSGDIGRYGRPLLYDPETIDAADAIVCESTYGGRVHPPQPLEQLHQALLQGVARGGAIVIPAFAVERTQDLLLAIGTIQKQDPKIAQLPIHLDSPMAEQVDELFAQFPDAHKPVPSGNGPDMTFGCQHLTLHRTTEESKALNHLQGSYAIISASGMAAGGRILHHIHNHIADRKATMIFVGYQGPGTLGHLLVRGATRIHILGDPLPVRAQIVSLQGYSAHADKNDFQRWLSTCATKPHLYAVHGEPESAAALVTLAESGFGWTGEVARRGTTVAI